MDHNLAAAAEDSKTSSSVDDSVRSDQTGDMGTGRSYECVFCKRGFTTAQALGGHMNIHRKDRVKTKTTGSTTSNPTKPEGFSHGSLRPTTPVAHHHQTYPSHHLSMASELLHVNYQTYLPSSTSTSTWCLGSTTSHDKADELYVHNNNPQLLNAFKENWTNMSLSSPVAGASHSTDHHHIQEKRSAGNDEDDELDLELRLGHDR